MSEPIDKDLGLDVDVQPASITIDEESDRDLEKRIRIFLFGMRRARLRHLDIEVQNGCAIINGKVHSFYERQLALSCCQRVAGVLSVTDKVEVGDEGRAYLGSADLNELALN